MVGHDTYNDHGTTTFPAYFSRDDDDHGPPGTGPPHVDIATLVLSLGLCTGLIISYLPQHLRIIRAGTSEGFSPWYLLLGATSSASGMLNLLIYTWPVMHACARTSAGVCFASLLGFIQVMLQWLLFSIILVLYLVYFPRHLKYQRTLPLSEPVPTAYGATGGIAEARLPHPDESDVIEERVDGYRKPVRAQLDTTPEWRLAVTLAWVVAIHLVLLLLLTLFMLVGHAPARLLNELALFLGLSGTLLAILQYAPQIFKTYRAGLVGALSLGTMAIQVPGSVLFVISIAVRPGTNWTSWIPYAVTGALQGGLLAICIAWKQRQKGLGIDDFGNPLEDSAGRSDEHDRLLSHE